MPINTRPKASTLCASKTELISTLCASKTELITTESSTLMLSFLLFLLSLYHSTAAKDVTAHKTYIVSVRAPEDSAPTDREALEEWYGSFFPPSAAASAKSRFIYIYSDAITGFAAKLADDELKYMEKKEGFLTAYEDRLLPLMTTRTPEFLGLQPGNGFWDGSGMGKGIIIGLLDSGILPGHPSFDDEGMSPPPSRWKGTCDFGKNVGGCNNKVIGAKSFLNSARGGMTAENLQPIDDSGHGTHTASTAVGNFVKNANVIGSCNGTAAGMAPYAHLAVYKVCAPDGCFDSDILAGMDAAIQDGVDIMSMSLGPVGSQPLPEDVIAVGAYHAIKRNILVSCAAGNAGPDAASLSSEAPWVLTVGAATIDRKIRATVKLGNGQEFEGESAFQPADYNSAMLPLVYPQSSELSNCDPTTLTDVKGKIVVCNRADSRIKMGTDVKNAGGAGMIVANGAPDGYTTFADAHYLPASDVDFVDATKIISYITSTPNPTASISFKGTILKTSPAPTVASFSSRGPAVQSLGILKPDIIGPGANVLAAWPFQVGPGNNSSATSATFNVISGTSMSTPHLAGIAALIKSKHPDWSPHMIKSAIMTTSDVADRDGKPIVDENLNPANYFAMGAGFVNPSKAAEPGLVYDSYETQYVAYLCGLGYSDQQIEHITQNKTDCKVSGTITGSDLNYPSIMVNMKSDSVTVNRTVVNVGEDLKYTANVDVPKGVTVTVSPETLEFTKVNETKTFLVTLSWNSGAVGGDFVEGSLKWVSNKYVVRSPILMVKNS